tara:strand:+ start:31 stop:861 length:831 start_codon:yes stop_codon:yes gene_type:complete
MAKKTKTKEVMVEETVTMEKPTFVPDEHQVSKIKKEDTWEIKDRTYILNKSYTPLSYTLKARGVYWFDEEKGYERELKYCRNQKTVFVDEMKGPQVLERIVFRNGVLRVPKELVTLQKLLSIYHPGNGVVYTEVKPVVEASNEIERLDLEVDALVAARTMDVEVAEAIMRVEIGSKVSNMSSKELRRDLLLFAKRKPRVILELQKDENVFLRNKGVKAVEQGLIHLSNDQRTFTWRSSGRKLMNVPFNEHPYSALAAWFKTDEGMEVLKAVEKELS